MMRIATHQRKQKGYLCLARLIMENFATLLLLKFVEIMSYSCPHSCGSDPLASRVIYPPSITSLGDYTCILAHCQMALCGPLFLA